MLRRPSLFGLLATALLVALALGPLLARPAVAAPTMPTYLMADMVTLDRAYIAALALTSQEKLEPSQRSMAVLVPTWQAFHAKYAGANPADPQWRPNFDEITGMVDRANEIVRSGSSLVAAHDELEEVRITMMHLRERNGLPYYVDLLTRYHEPMEAIVLAGKGKNPESLSAADLETIRAELPVAQAIWEQVTAAQFDASLFGFGAERQAAVQKQVAAESQALAQLQAALDANDTQAIIQRSVGLKPPFSVLFMLFGDFEQLG